MTPAGPTANLPGYVRRSGKSGRVFRDGNFLQEIVGIEWTIEVEQVPVEMAGSFRTETKPGGETRRGSFRIQDLDDRWANEVLSFLKARRNNDRSSAFFPEFSIVTMLDDIGAPAATRYQLDGVQLFQVEGGFATADDLLVRDIPFTFRDEQMLDGFKYSDGGIVPLQT